MLRTILNTIPRDKDLPERAWTMDVLSRILNGALYEQIAYEFWQEKNDAQEYVPLRSRRPSVHYNLCRVVVDDSVAVLFSDGHFPSLELDDPVARDNVRLIAKASQLNACMVEAATIGACGSVAIHFAARKQGNDTYRPFLTVHSTQYLTPMWQDAAPDTLAGVTQRYKIKGSDLKAKGYTIKSDDLNVTYWFERHWNDVEETWFLPYKPEDMHKQGFVKQRDAVRSVRHDLDFVPWVWIRNLPGKLKLFSSEAGAPQYSDADGASTFASLVDWMIEIDYQLSQGGRGLRYTMDPLLIVKEPVAQRDEFVRSPANAMILDEGGDAKLLELTGRSFETVMEWVRALRELALEAAHGNRADPQKMAAAQSGRAMELMNQGLIWLVDKLRTSYGECGMLQVARMMIAAHAKYPLASNGVTIAPIDPAATPTLNWPPFYALTAQDLSAQAQTMSTLRDAGVISRETAIKNIAPAYDIEDVAAEMTQIAADRAADVALMPAAKDAETLNVPA